MDVRLSVGNRRGGEEKIYTMMTDEKIPNTKTKCYIILYRRNYYGNQKFYSRNLE